MTRLPAVRWNVWFPGAVLLVAAAGLGVLVGIALGVRSWPVYLGLVLAALLAIGWIEHLWARRPAPPRPPASRGKLKVIRGGKADYDLEKDSSTDSQRYLM